jgi:hypothetical protein
MSGVLKMGTAGLCEIASDFATKLSYVNDPVSYLWDKKLLYFEWDKIVQFVQMSMTKKILTDNLIIIYDESDQQNFA